MVTIAFFECMRKLVIGALPVRRARARLTSGLEAMLFPEELADIRISAERAVSLGLAAKQQLTEASDCPAAVIHSAPGQPVPDVFHLPRSVCPPLYEYVFEGGHCYRTFALDAERHFIENALPARLFQTDLHKHSTSIRAVRPRFVKGHAIALNTGHTDNYYHWLTEIVGRMLVLPDWQDALICTDTRFAFQRDTLRLLGIPGERIIPVSKYHLYQFERLSVISAPVHLSCPAAYEALREFGRSVAGDAVDPATPSRIYISRSDVPGRRGIANEKELEGVLAEFGFTALTLSGLPLERQMALLHGAQYVIFPHGAGGTNLLFARPGTRFLEIISPVYHDIGYVRFSRCMDLHHYILSGEDAQGTGKQSCYRVDPRKLRDALVLMTQP